ncbi:SRPBCC family protein [Rhodoglobus aureus]|uniref:SRPBCC family protein n=1 Tax=Rhodoglobus aureus TaxID=191497 RepID=A0ABN1VPS5_9MICO
MGTVTKDIEVDVPISVAYNQWTQFESFPAFMSGVNSITQLDDRKLHWEVSVGGVDREFDADIVEQHPDERIAWRSTGEILQIDDMQISKDLSEFKRLIESNGFESGKWRGEIPRADDGLGR